MDITTNLKAGDILMPWDFFIFYLSVNSTRGAGLIINFADQSVRRPRR